MITTSLEYSSILELLISKFWSIANSFVYEQSHSSGFSSACLRHHLIHYRRFRRHVYLFDTIGERLGSLFFYCFLYATMRVYKSGWACAGCIVLGERENSTVYRTFLSPLHRCLGTMLKYSACFDWCLSISCCDDWLLCCDRYHSGFLHLLWNIR